ncbi:hypothetical protein GCM10010353_58850 [Streptomyces chryseus]|nr:hypothetical protein GCM10010353_58850 [Streptomyces chryseus]
MRGTDDVRRQLPYEFDLLLREDRDAGFEGLLGVLLVAYEPDALAVVAAAHGLEDHREAAGLGGEGRRVRRVAHDAVARARRSDLRELRSHDALVLGVHQCVGPRADGDAVRFQGPQVLGRDVLVIEGDHVAAAREGAQRVQIAVVADDDVADDLGRRVLGGVTEELESDAEGDARLVGHTGELTATDHADYGERHSSRVSAGPALPARVVRPLRASARSPGPAHPPRTTSTRLPGSTRPARGRAGA